MQTLTFVPTLLPAAPAAPGSCPAPPPQRRASRARLRRRRNGESFKFGCKATGNRVHPPLRYRKIRLIVTGFSLLSLSLSRLYARSICIARCIRLAIHSMLDIITRCLSYLSKIIMTRLPAAEVFRGQRVADFHHLCICAVRFLLRISAITHFKVIVYFFKYMYQKKDRLF